eukprot:gnl/MRDRNA2_/MRDRNA2_137548_c0_seq1.p1 gnl/MRDRNA2_/MRDRNA2_137548_c0~~gnl/MRDRNA2_/MRDRNA2_137548_c0_seq1.p1  ORF type:complete len:297 (-),score=41.58 gnl/MRDRNA2_/MRDRNA2_137548_c0_seq1:11-901(-)
MQQMGMVFRFWFCLHATWHATGEPEPIANGREETCYNFRVTNLRSKLRGGGDEGRDGNFTVLVHRSWAPNAAKRFDELVRDGFYTGVRFHRVTGQKAIFGVSAVPGRGQLWRERDMQEDTAKEQNLRSRLSFSVNSDTGLRSTEIFINLVDNVHLDSQGMVPFAEVLGNGMKVVDKLYSYGESASATPIDPSRIESDGEKYLEQEFPKLSWIKGITITETPAEADATVDEDPLMHSAPMHYWGIIFAALLMTCAGMKMYRDAGNARTEVRMLEIESETHKRNFRGRSYGNSLGGME